MNPITYTSNQVGDYSDAVNAAKSLPELMAVLEDYKSLANDALQAAPKNEEEFKVFRAGLAKERKKKFAGEEFALRFGPVLMPILMLRVSLVANHFHVPFGLAFTRLLEAGAIVKRDDGIYVMLGSN